MTIAQPVHCHTCVSMTEYSAFFDVKKFTVPNPSWCRRLLISPKSEEDIIGDATQTAMMVMMKKGISDGFYSTGSAFGVCFFIIVLLISAVVTKLMGKWSEAIQ